MSKSYHPLIRRPYPRVISLVVPIYNEAAVIPLLLARLDGLLNQIACETEIILVNDGSSDRSMDLLLERAEKDHRYKVVGLARNFGHQIAATAGLDCARGDAVALMDADLQDPPEIVLKMIAKYEEGFDVVYARRIKRDGESVFKRFTAWIFYRMMRAMVHKDLPLDTGDFRLVSRRCLDALKSMKELHRFLRGMVAWVGFPQTNVDFVRPPRAAGTTKYPLRKMLPLAWNAALSFSALPLRLSFYFGILLIGIAAAYAGYGLWRIFSGEYVVPGWLSQLVVSCLTSGAIMLSLGILGEYVGRIFEEIKQRPLYTILMTANMENAGKERETYEDELTGPV